MTFARAIEVVDHRLTGFGTLYGRDTVLAAVGAFLDLVEGSSWQTDDVLASAADSLLLLSTNRGHDKASGGTFERCIHSLFRFDDDGLIDRWEIFEAEHGAEALARFDELLRPATAPSRRRPPRANRATAWAAAFDAAFARGDMTAIEGMFARNYRELDRPTGGNWGYDGLVKSLRALLRSNAPEFRFYPLVTLGENLALGRKHVAASASGGSRFDVGAYSNETISVVTCTDSGQVDSIEILSTDHLGDALARLYELYAEQLPEGAERDSISITARAITNSVSSEVVANAERLFAPDFEAVDHRPLVGHEGVSFEALRRGDTAWKESTEKLRFRVDDILAFHRHAFLRRTTTIGTLRAGGGIAERSAYALTTFAVDGRCARNEVFDLAQENLAWSRFEELTAAPTPESPPRRRVNPNTATTNFEAVEAAPTPAASTHFENLALRAWRVWLDVWMARDWERFTTMMRRDCRLLDRRRMAQIDLEGDRILAYTRQLGDMGTTRFHPTTLLATRGEFLCLTRDVLHVAGDEVGPSTIEYLSVVDTDGEGLIRAVVRFDADDLDAAMAELQARYLAGEGANVVDTMGRFEAAIALRDWPAIIEMGNPAMIERDLRPLAVLETSRGPDAWIQSFKNLAEMAPDMRWFTNHMRQAGRVWISSGGWRGTQQGGDFEIPFVVVGTLDESGRYDRIELRDLAQLDDAWARYDELVRAEAGAGRDGAVVRRRVAQTPPNL